MTLLALLRAGARFKVPTPVLATAIVGIAFALRVYRLPEVPPGLYGDEGWNLVDILEMRETGKFPLYFPNNFGREPFLSIFKHS